MSTDFPTSLDSYTTKVDSVDDVLAAHVNDLQDAVVAIETAFGVQTTWTPVLTQLAAVAHTVSFAKYVLNTRTKLAHIECKLVVTGSGTGGNAITITGWPAGINPAWTGFNPVGGFAVFDSGARAYTYPAIWDGASIHGRDNVTADKLGINPNIALAANDEVYLNATWFIA